MEFIMLELKENSYVIYGSFMSSLMHNPLELIDEYPHVVYH